MKIILQFVFYMAYGILFLLIPPSVYFSTFSEPGMTFLPIAITLISSLIFGITSIICIWWALAAIPSMRTNYPRLTESLPKYFNNYFLPVIVMLLIFTAGYIGTYATRMQGENLGFEDGSGFSKARENKIYDKNEWLAFKSKEDEVETAAALETKNKNYIESKINSLDRSSGKYLVAENIYKQHGVWVDDYIAVQKKSCSHEYNRLLAANTASEQAIEYWNQTSDALTRSGVSPSAGGRSPTTDPDIQRTSSNIRFARSQLENCGVAHLNEIEHRVTVQSDN